MSDRWGGVKAYWSDDPKNTESKFRTIKIRTPDNYYLIDARLIDTELLEQLAKMVAGGHRLLPIILASALRRTDE